MAVIFPDTNQFIDFYRAHNDYLPVFDAIVKNAKSFVLTQQTIDEFNRNRLTTLNRVLKAFKDSVKVPVHSTSLLASLPSFQKLKAARTSYEQQAEVVIRALQQLINERSADPVRKKVDELFAKCEQKYRVTDEAFSRAHRRKLLGNPPTSPEKQTIGDEVNWEVLLESCRDDLILWTRDGTYAANQDYLAAEYKRITDKSLLLITDKFSEAMKKLGAKPSEELIEQEQKLQEDVREYWEIAGVQTVTTRELLREALGLNDEEIDRLRTDSLYPTQFGR